MAYINSDDFTTYSPSTTIDENLFAELAERASEVIDRLTFDRITLAGGLSGLSTATQEAVKKATCAQIQTMYAQGGLSTVEGFGAEANQQYMQVGKFSIGTANSNQGDPLATVDGVPISPMVTGYLRRTGLLYRGVG